MLWLATTAVLFATVLLYNAGSRWWWLPAPGSFRSRFAAEARSRLKAPESSAPTHAATLVTEAELAVLPPLMQEYLRRMGSVGAPRVRNIRVQFDAEIRGGANEPWMKATARQYEWFAPPERLFYLRATRKGVPFDVFHRYVGDSASMKVRLAGLIPVTNIAGPVMTQSETVTLLNDVVVLAPAAVLDLPITWATFDEHAVRATFTNAGCTVSAILTFDAAGDLVGFVSNDRYQSDARGDRNVPWSTPISGYEVVNGIRVGTRGLANWIEPTGEWTYGRFTITDIAYNVTN